MADKIEIVGLVGGEVVSNTDGSSGAREVVFALPLSRLLVRLVRVPAEETDLTAFLTPLLQELSPYPDEDLTVGWELVSENERGKIVLAAGLPESSADDIAEILDAQKLRVTRLDALIFGELRALWPSIAPNGDLGNARRMVLLASDGALEMVVLDGDLPSAIRFVPAGSDFRREAMLCLLEAENFGGAKPLAEIVTVAPVDAVTLERDPPVDAEALRVQLETSLSSFAPIRSVPPVSVQETLDAIAARSAEANALDARPASWREYLEETRFKLKLTKGIAAAVGVWLVVMGVLFGVPMTYGYMADYQKGLSKHHQKAYVNVRDMKAKVELVRKYSDHTRGALEMMKAVSDRVPDGVELDNWDFKREDGVTLSGLADETKAVYDLKDLLTELADDAGEHVFGLVRLGRLTSAKGNRQKFTLECRYQAEEEE